VRGFDSRSRRVSRSIFNYTATLKNLARNKDQPKIKGVTCRGKRRKNMTGVGKKKKYHRQKWENKISRYDEFYFRKPLSNNGGKISA
jgi:hypothetical protein